jgi:6-pyruvoyltetrahydropterin/6-carboxytetrahydropterin synthase
MAVTVSGSPDREGMIVDFAEVKKTVSDEIVSQFDHSYLNDVIPQPTVENIARYAFERLDAKLRRPNCELFEVKIWESPGSSVAFRREDL